MKRVKGFLITFLFLVFFSSQRVNSQELSRFSVIPWVLYRTINFENNKKTEHYVFSNTVYLGMGVVVLGVSAYYYGVYKGLNILSKKLFSTTNHIITVLQSNNSTKNS